MDDVTMRLRSRALEWRVVEGEVIAIDGDTSQYLGLNGSGALLWQRLAEGSTRNGLVELLRSSFSLERGQAEADVDAFLASLEENRLLEHDAPDAQTG
jgi:Coenzyme PQQ synthesis protein D (PqqD)